MNRRRLIIENCSYRGELSSILIEDGIIREVRRGEPFSTAHAEKRIDGRGSTVLPGLIDSHCHPFELGRMRRNVDLRGTQSITALRLRLFAKLQKTKPGEWVVARGWDHEAFSERRLPSKDDIDDISRENPVILVRVCGHIALLNSRAIEVTGLDSAAGVEYQRDEAGNLTGIIKEKALERALASVPTGGKTAALEDLLAAGYEAVKNGLTTLHCIVSPEGFVDQLDALMSLKAEGGGPVRLRVYVPPNSLSYIREKELTKRLNGDMVRINGVKIFADGSLGGRTAALREPYSDDPSNTGILRYSDEQLAELVEEADRMKLQAIVHAIGDRAVEQAIQAIARVSGNGNPRRHRIEHASLAPEDLRSKMRKHRISVTVQPNFVISDSWAVQRLGDERVRDLYPFRSMLEEGIIASGSSDAPVEPISPLIGIWAAMVRSGYAPHERLSPSQAVLLYTENGAINGFDEDKSGRLEEGMSADLTILDSDAEGMHPAMFRKVGVAATVLGGEVVHSYEGT